MDNIDFDIINFELLKVIETFGPIMACCQTST